MKSDTNVIHAEMYFNNQRANAEAARDYGNPRDNWPDQKPLTEIELKLICGKKVKADMRQIAAFACGSAPLGEIDNLVEVMQGICLEWIGDDTDV